MLQSLGFGDISSDLVTAMIIIIVVASLFVGWITDGLMQDSGFGVIGNTFILFAGVCGGIVGWNKYIQPINYAPPMYVLSGAAGAAVGLLILLAILKRCT